MAAITAMAAITVTAAITVMAITVMAITDRKARSPETAEVTILTAAAPCKIRRRQPGYLTRLARGDVRLTRTPPPL